MYVRGLHKTKSLFCTFKNKKIFGSVQFQISGKAKILCSIHCTCIWLIAKWMFACCICSEEYIKTTVGSDNVVRHLDRYIRPRPSTFGILSCL